MFMAELKRKKHVWIPVFILLSIITFVLFSTPVRSSSISSFPNLQQPQQQKQQGGQQQAQQKQNDGEPLTKFQKTIFKDYDFDYTKIIYSSTNAKYSQQKQFNQETQQTTLFPGKQTILIMSVIGNSSPYGKDRNFNNFIQTIMTIVENQPDYIISLALLSNSDEEFLNIQNYFENNNNNQQQEGDKDNNLNSIFESITLISAPFLDKNTGFNRNERHKDSIQRLRRRLIAKSRNFLMLNSLQSQQFIMTIDSDMIRFDNPESLISRFINSKKDIIVPRIERPGLNDYDKNSWRGKRTKPNQEQLDKMDNNQWDTWNYVPHDVKNEIYHFLNYLENKDDEFELHKNDPDYLVPLDSVGGAVLFMKSIVIRQGVIFPTSLIVGTTWDRLEGYDGIETEGVCYLAKPLGFSCWGMPNIVAHHTG